MKAEQYSLMMTLREARRAAYFLKEIFPLSYHKDYKDPTHAYEWIATLQEHSKTVLLSARKHLKSTTMYAYVMWRLLNAKKDEEILYISYTGELARYHTSNIKALIKKNIFFEHYEDEKETSEGSIKFKTPAGHTFIVTPEGILSFKRGRHPDEAICLVPETKVMTRTGYVSISEVKAGDEVLTHTNNFHRVAGTIERFINQNITVLELENNERIRITDNHRVLTQRGWIRAEQLTEQDELTAL